MTDGARLLRYLLPGGVTLLAFASHALTIPAVRSGLNSVRPEDLRGFDAVALGGATIGATILAGYLVLNVHLGLTWFVRQKRPNPPPWSFGWIDDHFLLATHAPDIAVLNTLATQEMGAVNALVHLRSGLSEVDTPALKREYALLDQQNGLGASSTGLLLSCLVGVGLSMAGELGIGQSSDSVPFVAWAVSTSALATMFWNAQRRLSLAVTAYIDTVLRLTTPPNRPPSA